MISHYRHVFATANWQFEASALSSAQREWLLHSGSLTQKLCDVASHFNVEVVQEKWLENGEFAKNSPNLTACSEPIWLREVWLKEGDTPWIFAQTCVPKSTIDHIAPHLLTLGNEPIGRWLFAQNPIRQTLAWAQAENGLFARRGVYEIDGFALEIKELFLAEFPFLA